jgi:sugar O-acyltransferase (sialic acid O-acetyltransferase NeuD family)
MYLYGASGHAKVIIDIIKSMGLPIEGVFDDNKAVKQLNEFQVNHHWFGESPMIISIGNNKIRKIIADRLGCHFSKAIHNSAILSPSVTIDDGTVVMAGAIINADATIGKHCIINTGASIDHECVIDDYAHISPHATLCGNVSVGEGAWVGAGSVIKQGVKVGKWCVIGAGSVVINDIPDNTIVAGVPAKEIKQK